MFRLYMNSFRNFFGFELNNDLTNTIDYSNIHAKLIPTHSIRRVYVVFRNRFNR